MFGCKKIQVWEWRKDKEMGEKDIFVKELKSPKTKKEGISMCDVVESFVQQGVEKNTISSIKNLMKKLNMPVSEAMDILDVPEDKRTYYAEQLKN